ncbi:MAG: hypothetical protein NW224_11960 [Leptolyngbyaceae cyanobacterium bins.302]|nr:hypothetical protein [Leptolyngbyaceae cyanobacterium bins.302]
MTQSNENGNGSRLERLEAIMLDLASATVRHDNEFSRINQTLERINEQQEANSRAIALNREDINILTASIQDLRNTVADYIESRNQT